VVDHTQRRRARVAQFCELVLPLVSGLEAVRRGLSGT
jgi:hypothetical protein